MGLADLLAHARRRRGLASMLQLARRRSPIPQDVRSAIERVVRSAPAGARPSALIGQVRSLLDGDSLRVLAEHPGVVLAELRARVPGQPEVPLAPARRAPIAAEAFAGGGLYDLALTVEGIVVSEVCEIDEHAVASIRANLHPLARATDALVWSPSVPPGGLDVLTGGPPCQPFSKGRAMDVSDSLKGPADPRNMYPRVLEWVADAQPRIVCLENSAQLADDPEYRAYTAWWLKQLRELGYEGTVWRLSAASYGTPQNRLRAWVVAWPSGAPWGQVLRSPPPETYGKPGSEGVRSGRLLPWTRVFDRLNSGCCAGWGLTTCVNLGNVEGSCIFCVDGINYQPAPNTTRDELRVEVTPRRAEAMASKIDGQRFKIEKFRPAVASVASAWRQLRGDERRLTEYLAPTVIKRFSSGWEHGLLVPEGLGEWGDVDRGDPVAVKAWVSQLRGMGVRDAAKLQDVPQWYQFSGSRSQQLAQIGNGIPVNMGRAVARHLLRALGYTVPLPGSMAAGDLDTYRGPTSGLWPLDRLDPCAGLTAPLGYVESTPELQRVPYREPTPQQRRQRPNVTRQAFEQQRPFRERVQRRVAAIGADETRERHVPRQQRVGYWKPTPQSGTETYVHDWSWRPSRPRDAPPGFTDLQEFRAWVEGEDERVYEHYAKIYGW